MGRVSNSKVLDAVQQGRLLQQRRDFDIQDRLDALTEEVTRVSAGVSVLGAIAEIGAADARKAAENTEPDVVLEAVQIALREQAVISFPYIDSHGNTSTRVVSPYEIRVTRQGNRIVGYDHVRQQVRQFSPIGVRSVPAIEPRYEFLHPPIEGAE